MSQLALTSQLVADSQTQGQAVQGRVIGIETGMAQVLAQVGGLVREVQQQKRAVAPPPPVNITLRLDPRGWLTVLTPRPGATNLVLLVGTSVSPPASPRARDTHPYLPSSSSIPGGTSGGTPSPKKYRKKGDRVRTLASAGPLPSLGHYPSETEVEERVVKPSLVLKAKRKGGGDLPVAVLSLGRRAL